MNKGLRLFLAVVLPGELRRVVAALRTVFQPLLGRASWVRPEAMHVTLRFMGETDPALVEPMARALSEPLARIEPVEIEVAGAGAFGGPRRPRVLWLGLHDGGGLARLALQIDRALVPLDLPARDKPFRPHLTLCRVRKPGGHDLGPALRGVGELGRFRAEQVVLFENQLSSSGARHEVLQRFSLGDGGPT